MAEYIDKEGDALFVISDSLTDDDIRLNGDGFHRGVLLDVDRGWETPMLQGLRSQIYQVADLEAAKVWYTALLGRPPYFDEPFYVGFNVGGYELGLQPSDDPDAGQAWEAVTYWGVPDAEAAFAHLVASGAAAYQQVQEVGGGIKLGAVRDPMGGILGVIENPHFLAALAGFFAGEGEPGLTFSLHIGQNLLEQIQDGARSARVSLEEYVGECAVDGLIRGYR